MVILSIVGLFGIVFVEKTNFFSQEVPDRTQKPLIAISRDEALIADHTVMNAVRFDEIPVSAINQSKETLHIAYGHTSHGSQLITGMSALVPFKEANGGLPGLYAWHDGPQPDALDLDDYFVSGDLGHAGDLTWETRTRTYLENDDHDDVNVVMWSWCGGCSDNTEEGINIYLNAMNQLEIDYPEINFVYMTGHADGTGEEGNLHMRNQQIRNYCVTNNKVLYDFYDIECYNLDGDYFGDKAVNDECYYDTNGDGSRDGNWASEWQSTHTEGSDWFDCSPAHTEAVNGNQKAYAVWWLWARLAGWNPDSEGDTNSSTSTSSTSTTASTSSSSLPEKSIDRSSILDSIPFSGLYIPFMAIPVLVFYYRRKTRSQSECDPH